MREWLMLRSIIDANFWVRNKNNHHFYQFPIRNRKTKLKLFSKKIKIRNSEWYNLQAFIEEIEKKIIII